MRITRLTTIGAAIAAASALAFTGCATEDAKTDPASSSGSASTSASPKASASASATKPAACSKTSITAKGDKAGLAVSGAAGKKPTIKHVAGDPKKDLQINVTKAGTGPVVKKGDLLTAHYIGQIWCSGKVFDNSFDRAAPASFPIGVNGVIPGWDKGLVGKKVGSRVELVIPPALGYGSEGASQAGIGGTDTLIFVVDIVGTWSGSTPLNAAAAKPTPAGYPKVAGPLNAQPKVSIPTGVKAPAKPKPMVVIARGKGPQVKAGWTIVARYLMADYKGKKVLSTWDPQPNQQTGKTQPASPQELPVKSASAGSGPLDALVGVPVGSRVLIELPAQKDSAGKSIQVFAVVDVLAGFPAAKG